MSQSATALYNAAYEEGYRAALKELKTRELRKSVITEYKANNREAKHSYALTLIKQKVAGIVLLAASFAGLYLTGGDFGVSLVLIPLGLGVLVTNRRIFN